MSDADEMRTARLTCRRMGVDDHELLHRLNSDTRTVATLGGLRTAEQTRTCHERHLQHWAEHGFGWWLWFEEGSGAFVGRGGLRHLTLEGIPEIELGYALLSDHWGRGLGTEFARAAVRLGFELLHLSEIIAVTLPTNAASQNVMRKTGFRYERDCVHADMPHVLYRLRCNEWEQVARPNIGRSP